MRRLALPNELLKKPWIQIQIRIRIRISLMCTFACQHMWECMFEKCHMYSIKFFIYERIYVSKVSRLVHHSCEKPRSVTLVWVHIKLNWLTDKHCFLVQPLPGWAPIMGWAFLKTGFLACSWSIWFWLGIETFYGLVSVFYMAFTLVWMVFSHAFTL